jgi:hypothetical protein
MRDGRLSGSRPEVRFLTVFDVIAAEASKIAISTVRDLALEEPAHESLALEGSR